MSLETIPVQQPHPLSVGALLGEPLRTILRPAGDIFFHPSLAESAATAP